MHADFFESRRAITEFLYLRDDPEPVDLCFVLGTPTPWTMQPAIELFRAGFAPKILISGRGRRMVGERRRDARRRPSECEMLKAHALENGIPEAAILIESRATNTLENFVFARPIIERELGWSQVNSIALVGKPFHMRRVLMTARRHWPDHVNYVMQPTTDPRDEPDDVWWRSESGRRWVMTELRAIGAYGLTGDLGGF